MGPVRLFGTLGIACCLFRGMKHDWMERSLSLAAWLELQASMSEPSTDVEPGPSL